jgi:hypothetical protein
VICGDPDVEYPPTMPMLPAETTGLPDAVSAVEELESITSDPAIVMVGDPLSATLPLSVGLRAMIDVPTDAVLVTVTGKAVHRAIVTVIGTLPRSK